MEHWGNWICYLYPRISTPWKFNDMRRKGINKSLTLFNKCAMDSSKNGLAWQYFLCTRFYIKISRFITNTSKQKRFYSGEYLVISIFTPTIVIREYLLNLILYVFFTPTMCSQQPRVSEQKIWDHCLFNFKAIWKYVTGVVRTSFKCIGGMTRK